MGQPEPTLPADSIRVLHVDDEKNTLKFTKSIVELSDRTIHMEPVATIEEALTRLGEEHFDCIVSDFQMPGLDGIEFARRIRETSDTPFIIYTGQGSEEVAETAFIRGIDDYIRKETNPSHYQVLTRRIRVAVDKHRAERALQRQLKETQIILDSVPAMIFYKDKENRLVSVNQTLIDSIGLTREELEGRDLAEFSPDLAEKYWKDDLEVINTGRAKYGIVEPLETPDGVRWLTTDKIPYRDEEGEITGIIGFSIDITERIQVEDELRRSEERYRGLFELSPDVIMTGDMKGFITSANPAFTLATGYPVENIIGKHFTKTGYLLAREIPKYIMMFSFIVRGKKVPPFEFEYKHKDGTIRWAEAHIGFQEVDGKKVGVQGVIRDITEHKNYETRLEVLHNHVLELASAEDIEDIADVTLKAIESVFGYQWSDFNVVQDNFLMPLLISDEELRNNMTLSLDGPGIIVRAYRTGESQLVHDVRLDDDYVMGRGSEGEPWLSELAVPVKIGDDVVAVINSEDKKLGAFTESDRNLVEIFAEHVASSISRLRQLESIQGSEEKYRSLIESSMDPVFVFDEEKYLYVNRRASELLGYEDPKMLIGQDAYHHVAPEFREMVRERAVARQRGEEQPSNYEISLVRRDGSPVPVEVNVTAITLEGKQVSLAVNKDLSEIKKNEETLLALHRFAKDIAGCLSLEEVYEHTVRVMTETLNFPRVDILMVEGNVLKQVCKFGSIPLGVEIPLDGKGVTVKAIREKRSLIVNDVSQSEDYIYAIGDSIEPFNGYPLSLSELVSPIIIEGEAVGVLNVESTRIDSFTEQNQTFLELLAMHVASGVDRLSQIEELETLVEEKTSALVDAERMVAAGRISSMLAHDLRGPLQVIKNSLYMMNHDPEKKDEMMKLIDSSVDYAEEMLEELRIRTREDRPHKTAIDLRDLLNKAVTETSLPDNIDMDINLGDDLDSIVVDPTQIRRVIDNLIRNAAEAMPKGGDLKVSCEVRGDVVVITVSDTGVGIPEDELGNLFQPFYSTKSRGIGLGLVYCKRMIEAHGGTITVESEVEKGTVFTISMPVHPSEPL